MQAGDTSFISEMKTGFAALRSEMHEEFAAIRSDIQTYNVSHREDIQELRADLNSFKNTMIVVILGSWVTLMAAFIGIYLIQ